jgi:hypothetical protein
MSPARSHILPVRSCRYALICCVVACTILASGCSCSPSVPPPSQPSPGMVSGPGSRVLSAPASQQGNPEPPYFASMKEGLKLERQGQYKEAMARYRTALTLVGGVDKEIQNQATIAVHNRLGACYRSLGNVGEAQKAFERSLALGDKRFAPKALKKLREARK